MKRVVTCIYGSKYWDVPTMTSPGDVNALEFLGDPWFREDLELRMILPPFGGQGGLETGRQGLGAHDFFMLVG